MAGDNEAPKNGATLSEEHDRKFTSIALGLTFLSIGILLIFFPDRLGTPTVTTLFRWFFIILGAAWLLFEKWDGKKYGIHGLGHILVGGLLLGAWIFLFLSFNLWWVNFLGLLLLLPGLYGIYRGLLAFFYSYFCRIRQKKNSSLPITSEIFLFATKVCSLILLIIQVISAVNALQKT